MFLSLFLYHIHTMYWIVDFMRKITLVFLSKLNIGSNVVHCQLYSQQRRSVVVWDLWAISKMRSACAYFLRSFIPDEWVLFDEPNTKWWLSLILKEYTLRLLFMPFLWLSLISVSCRFSLYVRVLLHYRPIKEAFLTNASFGKQLGR